MAFAQFVFAITDAMVSQLVDRFTHTPWSSLIQIAIDAQIKVEDRAARGVYLLGREIGGEVSTVYVEQSNSALYDRLSAHATFLRDRHGLLYDGLRFKALGVVIFDSVALEERLIAEYRTQWIKNNPLSGWNGSGIDSNDTEDARDKQKLSRFDRRFPINNALVQREAKT